MQVILSGAGDNLSGAGDELSEGDVVLGTAVEADPAKGTRRSGAAPKEVGNAKGSSSPG